MNDLYNFFSKLFYDDFASRATGMCTGWTSGLLITHNIFDFCTFLAYCLIPLIILYVMRHRNVPFRIIFAAFAVFIFSCGFGHLVDIITGYWPIYRAYAVVKGVTAAASLVTVWGLLKIIPDIMSLHTTEELEKALEKSKQEHITLVRELHHRVKNNMQIINSLLDIKCKGLVNTDEISAIQSRIMSMAIVHGHFYKSESVKHISMRNYLDKLMDATITKAKKIITGDIDLDLTTAIPCGMLMNEVIMNCEKHAFNNKTANPTINATLSQDGGNAVVIIRDNGIGISSNANNSFGIKLINTLAKQLNGKVDFSVDNGTIVKITFPLVQVLT